MKDRKILEKRIGKDVKDAPAVSVIIPAYNVAAFVSETLDSVFAQTFKDFEVVLVNDGSPDTAELEKILAPYFEKIVYIKQENGGASAARNTAIENARGAFLAFLDGDDVWLPEYLETQLKMLERKNCDLVYCDAFLFGNTRGSDSRFMEKSPSSGPVTTESLIEATCSVITSGTVAKKEKVIEAGLFDENLPRIGMEDFDLWFRMARGVAKLDYHTTPLLRYRVRPDSLSGSNVKRAERNVRVMEITKEKYNLTDSEKTAMENYLVFARAELELEKGKLELTRENFAAARRHLQAANRFYRKPTFYLAIFLLAVSPKIVLRLFRRIRPAEASFIEPQATAES
jgi:Glycosyltransferases involved in cell wall biogenesis